MIVHRGVVAFIVAASLSCACRAEERVNLNVPAGTLAGAVLAVGTQSGITIGLTDRSLATIIVRGVRGRLSVAAALSRLLAGTAATVERIDAVTYRIVRRASRPAPPITVPATSSPPVPTPVSPDIVVTGSKRATLYQAYPGSVIIVDPATLRSGRAIIGSQALVEQQAVLSSTHLGPGRNKLFIRGIADSSFSGPTQATVGQYLGDVRLNYNAPDPDLALYDITSIEILEGPQSTLYGAGSLGGILRIEPAVPDLSDWSLTLDGGAAATAHGQPSGDAAFVVNAPIAGDRLALRVVGYIGFEGGYIDDPARGRRDTNGIHTRGGRATLRYRPTPSWTIDVGGVLQDINSRDGQYAERGLPPLERATTLAQPFDNDYALASLAIHHDMGAFTLASSTSVIAHDLTTTYDAATGAAPLAYIEHERIGIVSNETRLAHPSMNGGASWVAGIQLLRSDDRFARTLGPVGSPAPLAGERNLVEEGSLFGEATIPLTHRLAATAGGRFVYTRLVGETRDRPEFVDESHRHDQSLLPSAGLLWTVTPRIRLFARYQQGYRPGGLSTDQQSVQRFEADHVTTGEVGIRFHEPQARFSASAAMSYTDWKDIQADLVTPAGLPYIANIGSGTIVGFEARTRWRPVAGLVADASLFLNDSGLASPAAGFVGERDESLPDVADVVASLALRYGLAIGRHTVTLSGSIHYVGRSRLGVGTVLDLPQGRYADTAAGVRVPFGRFSLSADLTNLIDRRRNIFALGDPFGVAAGRQVTPLRPRTLRVGASLAF